LLIVALVASGYGFCQTRAKTPDGYFVGFPSYWNIVAFYLYALRLPSWLAAAIVLVLALLTFVPSYYLYPSRGGTLSRLTNFLGGVWLVLLAWTLAALAGSDAPDAPPDAQRHAYYLALASLFYPVYYMAASWIITLQRWGRLNWTLD
jgi:phosphatidylcholine synthase